jgi:hypothetical protein
MPLECVEACLDKWQGQLKSFHIDECGSNVLKKIMTCKNLEVLKIKYGSIVGVTLEEVRGKYWATSEQTT